MSAPTKARQYILAKQPTDKVDVSTHFKLVENDIPSLQDGQVLAKILYLSNDPAQRTWIQANQKADRLYIPPVNEGEVMKAGVIAVVVESKSSQIPKDSLISAATGWSQYAVVNEKDARLVQKLEGVSETQFLGALGGPGLTAMHGLDRVKVSSKDELLVVSGAAGATGSMVVQIAKKMLGVKRVIGIAGTDEKCRWVEKLGADQCLNYRSSTFADDLERVCQGKADVYYDNVGGEILDLMLGQMVKFGRVVACGAISQYNASEPMKMKNWAQVVFMRIEIAGIIVLDAASQFQDMTEKLVRAYKEGKLVVDVENETVVPTKFEDIPKTWLMLFEGGNRGKLVTKIED